MPVICTPCDSFKELGIKDGENAIVLDFDMNNVDIDRIYKSRLKFKYEPPKDIYDKLLDGKSTYDYTKLGFETVQCVKDYCDSVTMEIKTPMSKPYTLNKDRAKLLQEKGYVRIL